jgi:uncharacterized membrane protein
MPAGRSLEGRVARILTIGTFGAVGLLLIGSVLLIASGRSPLDPAPALDVGRLVADVTALQPAGPLWLGLVLIIATPGARVVAALVGYLQLGEREMVLISALVLAVIAGGVVAGTVGG